MKIAFTGTASTGKTTLVQELFKNEEFLSFGLQFITTNARGILDSLGARQMDEMTKEERLKFQLLYFECKKSLELEKSNFITDRSFVDVASYWLVREHNYELEVADPIILECQKQAMSYDMHFYFPYGVIPFHADGYRSHNEWLRKAIDDQIRNYLQSWQLPFIVLDIADIRTRINQVLNELRELF